MFDRNKLFRGNMIQKLIRSKAQFTLNTSVEMYMLSVGEIRWISFLSEQQAHALFQTGQIEEMPSDVEEHHHEDCHEEHHHEDHHEDHEDCHEDHHEDCYEEPETIEQLLSGHGRYRVRYVSEYGALLVTRRHRH